MFRYRALFQNKLVEGTIEAGDEKEALEKLRQQGFLVLSLESLRKSKGRGGRKDYAFLEEFTRDMIQLLKAGLSIEKALLFIAETHKKYRKELMSAVQELKKGSPFHQALMITGLFPRDYVELIKAGEESGKLEDTLELLYEFYTIFNRFKKELISSLTYPLFLASVTLFALVILSSYVIPKFKTLFQTAEGEIPLITKLVFILSDNLNNLIISSIVFLILLLLLIIFLRKNEILRYKFEKIVVKIPVIGEKIVTYDIIKVSYSMYTLLKGGVPLDRSLEIVRDIVSLLLVREALDRALKKVREGEPLHRSLNGDVFPELVVEIIKVGEESGELAGAWYQVYITFSEKLKDFMKTLTTLLEPAIILFMGLIVGFIVFGIIVGVFSLTGYM